MPSVELEPVLGVAEHPAYPLGHRGSSMPGGHPDVHVQRAPRPV